MHNETLNHEDLVQNENSVLVPFFAVGCAILFVSVAMFILYLRGIMKNLSLSEKSQDGNYEEKSLSEVWIFFVVVIVFYFSLTSGENMFFGRV